MAKRKKDAPEGVYVTFSYYVPLEEFPKDVRDNPEDLENMAVELAQLGTPDIEVEADR